MIFSAIEKDMILEALWEELRRYKTEKELLEYQLTETNENLNNCLLEEINDYDLKLTRLDNLYEKIKES